MPRKISILIVDDEESVRDSLYNWFIEDGYDVECAENAKQALSILELKKALRDIGSDLVIRIGNPGEVISELARELGLPAAAPLTE